jgi:tetratricopeptide (TPR) repeat protein
MMAIARALLLSTVMVSAPLVSARGAPRADPATQAKAHYDLGMTAYRLGYYDQAIGAFTRAHEIDPTPNLLYNIAQSYWKKGDNAQALMFYRRYLDAAPGAPDRELIQTRIRALSVPSSAAPEPPPVPAAAPASPRFAASPPPPPAPAHTVVEDSAPPPIYRRPLFWSAVGIATLTAVVAFVWLRPKDRWTCQASDCFTTRTVP